MNEQRLFNVYSVSMVKGVNPPNVNYSRYDCIEGTIPYGFVDVVRARLLYTFGYYTVEIYLVDSDDIDRQLIAQLTDSSMDGVTDKLLAWIDKYQEYLNFLEKNVAHVTRIVDNLFEKSKQMSWDEFRNSFPDSHRVPIAEDTHNNEALAKVSNSRFRLMLPLSDAFTIEVSVTNLSDTDEPFVMITTESLHLA